MVDNRSSKKLSSSEKKNQMKTKAFILGTLVVGAGIIFGAYKLTTNIAGNEFEILSKEVEVIKENTDNYILGDKESEYNDLIAQSEDAIKNKKRKICKDFIDKVKKLEDKVIDENKEMCTSELEEIKKLNTDSLNEDKKREIESRINNIEELINDNKFKEAKDDLDKIKESNN